jgi:hypothetical protein
MRINLRNSSSSSVGAGVVWSGVGAFMAVRLRLLIVRCFIQKMK